MAKANFAENQLQQEVTFSIYKYFQEKFNVDIDIIIPSLSDEVNLGWDSGFLHPYSNQPAYQEGCNLFIQYKISEKLTTSRAAEWSEWGTEYFRFKIPHGKSDYHQWELLKKIADKNYPVFYVTNSVLDRYKLFEMRRNGCLLEHSPTLDIRLINKHKHVTFTDCSSDFKLHSFVEISRKSNTMEKLDAIVDLGDSYSLPSFMEKIHEAIHEAIHEYMNLIPYESYNYSDNDFLVRKYDVIRMYLIRIQECIENENYIYGYYLLNVFVKKFIGAQMFWIPKVKQET
jgi:hypothetical protein